MLGTTGRHETRRPLKGWIPRRPREQQDVGERERGEGNARRKWSGDSDERRSSPYSGETRGGAATKTTATTTTTITTIGRRRGVGIFLVSNMAADDGKVPRGIDEPW